MSFHEKSNAVMLGIMALVAGLYVVLVAGDLRGVPADAVGEVRYVTTLAFAMGVFVVLAVVAHILIAALAARSDGEVADAADERDHLIDLRGERRGGFVLHVGVLAALGLALKGGEPFWIAHALLAGLVLAEMVKATSKLIDYRRGL